MATFESWQNAFKALAVGDQLPFGRKLDTSQILWKSKSRKWMLEEALVRARTRRGKAMILLAIERHRELVLKKGTKRAARSIEDYV